MTANMLTAPEEGELFDLGPVSLRMLAEGTASETRMSVGEFAGGVGPWTVPHVHRQSEEAFYVLEGSFTFLLGDDERTAEVGAFIWIPRGARHMMRSDAARGRLLALWTPAGLEDFFKELSRLPADSIRDPDVRRRMSERFDSFPV